MVTLAILAVCLALILGRGPMRSQALETRAAAGALAQTLREARARAIATDQDIAVAIDPGRHVFAPDGGVPVHIDPAMSITMLPPTLTGSGGVKLIRFSEDGSSSGGGVVLGIGARRLAITVEWLTGQVKVANAP
jgi:general secretion pathway protein H